MVIKISNISQMQKRLSNIIQSVKGAMKRLWFSPVASAYFLHISRLCVAMLEAIDIHRPLLSVDTIGIAETIKFTDVVAWVMLISRENYYHMETLCLWLCKCFMSGLNNQRRFPRVF